MRTLLINRAVAVAALAGLVAAGCGDPNSCRSGTVLVIYTLSGPAVGADQLIIDVSVDGAPGKQSTLGLHSGQNHAAFEVTFPSGYPTGKSVDVTITAVRAGQGVASDSKSVTAPASCAKLELTVGDPTSGGDSDLGVDMSTPGTDDLGNSGGPGAPTVTPGSANVGVGRHVAISSDIPATYALDEGAAGGTVDANGVYTAPANPGTYHVTASSTADPTKQTKITITVVSLQLAIVAGQPGGFGDADGPAASARFNVPGLAVDQNGNVMITQFSSNVLRRLDVSTNTTSNVAGLRGTAGLTDLGGAFARFTAPQQPMASRSMARQTYFVDSEHVRYYDILNNQTSTPAILTRDATSMGAELDDLIISDDNTMLFDADPGSTLQLWKAQISGTTHLLTFLAGNGNGSASTDGAATVADFRRLSGLTYYNGKLYLSDSDLIRVIDPTSGAVSTFKNSASVIVHLTNTGFITSSSTGDLYVADGFAIQKVNVATGAVTLIAGSTTLSGEVDMPGAAARFDSIGSIAWSSAGYLYVNDYSHPTIRRVNLADNSVTTIAGKEAVKGSANGTGAAATFNNVGPVCIDKVGIAWVFDNGNNVIRRVDLSNGATTTVAGQVGLPGAMDGTGNLATLSTAVGCVFDMTGKLLFTEQQSHKVRRFDPATNKVDTFAGSGSATVVDGTLTSASFGYYPGGIAVNGPDVYVADSDAIRRITLGDSMVKTVAGSLNQLAEMDATGAAARFSNPGPIAISGGVLYVADSMQNTIRAVDLTSFQVTTVAGTKIMPGNADGAGAAARFSSAVTALVADGFGNILVADSGSDIIRQFNIASGQVSTIAGVRGLAGLQPGALPAAINTPRGLALTPKEDLVVTGVENAISIIQTQ